MSRTRRPMILRSLGATLLLAAGLTAASAARAQDAERDGGTADRADPDAGTTVVVEVDAGRARPAPRPPVETGIDAGAPEAGPPDAGVPPATPPDAGAQPISAADAAVPPVVIVPAPTDDGQGSVQYVPFPVLDNTSSVEDIVPLPELVRGTPAGALAVFAVCVVVLFIIRRSRRLFPEAGVLPRILRLLDLLGRLVVFAAGMTVVARAADPLFGDSYPWVLVAIALALGWSTRDVLPDTFAAAVLLFERRVRRGVWVRGDDFEGVVESLGLRAVWIRDPHGDRLAVPNRKLLTVTLQLQEHEGAVHDVTLRIEPGPRPSVVRRALLDAVLTSPQVAPSAQPVIRRDGKSPQLWHVRAHLLEERLGVSFEGELLERVESFLEWETRVAPLPPDEAGETTA